MITEARSLFVREESPPDGWTYARKEWDENERVVYELWLNPGTPLVPPNYMWIRCQTIDQKRFVFYTDWVDV